ncbi:FecR family protein [Proteiniphilum sp. UBA5384]|uniref:FecR family protein n=1 Tax=Proteiniphilum sp. UBA5384 TaxID=1947279 RepID=UPI0025E7FE91|nr:FecR family protein [Proteiniphilum sp. UBA5384]
MDKDLLHRFFKGNTNIDEEKQIRHWIEISEENKMAFKYERKIYDTLLTTSPITPVSEQKRQIIPWRKIGTAAAAVLLLLVSTLYIHTLVNPTPEYNTLIVPAGQHIHLILADNTDIWLNANSTFRYPSEFSGKHRTVYLDGEAFFDVSKDEKNPFLVKTTAGDIKVTGTSFNVEAYSKQGSFETSLFEGSVEIHKDKLKLATLRPNEKGVLTTDNKISITSISDNDKYLWRKGLVSFNDKKLEEIFLTLEKYFAVEIQIDTEHLSHHTYTGKFRQSDGIDYALRVLQKNIRFSYERDEETEIIHIK